MGIRRVMGILSKETRTMVAGVLKDIQGKIRHGSSVQIERQQTDRRNKKEKLRQETGGIRALLQRSPRSNNQPPFFLQ